ncbi:MAG: dephospho-CoA kinase [Porticoccaceae bacterium]|nr:dephospho-CoA kinase [Porticoccaceae bacterium]
MMLRIGLTGGIGSGKSTAAAEFKKLGVSVIDLDQLARDVVQTGTPALNKISDHFGEQILLESGELDRAELRNIIFGDAKEKEWLENLLHPLIRERQLELESRSTSPYLVIEIPLLVENIEAQKVDRILVVETPREDQVLRTMARSQLSESEVNDIISGQATAEERRAVAQDRIDNSGSIPELAAQVETLHISYCELAKTSKL